MPLLNRILDELDELYLVERVTRPHDEARLQYHPPSIVVQDDIEFDDAIAAYYNYHFSRCISPGAILSRAEAAGRAKEILEQVYRRRGQDILEAYKDAKQGTNGGLRTVLDYLMERLKEESLERHVRDVFDRHVARTAYEEQVAVVRELMDTLRRIQAPGIDFDRPERYARNYEELIRAYVEGIKQSSAQFRRL